MPEATGHDPGGDPLDHVRDAIGRWIRHHREFLGLSQESLRRRLHDRGVRVSQSTLSRWEQGRAVPPGDVIPLLGRALGAPLDDLEELVARAAARENVDLTGHSFEKLHDDGARAARGGHVPRAAALFEAAHHLVLMGEARPPAADHALVLLRLAWARLHMWHLNLARAALQQLSDLADLPEDAWTRALCLHLTISARSRDRVAARAFASAIEARIADPACPIAVRAVGSHTLGRWHFLEERYRRALPFLSTAVDSWRECDNPLEASRADALLAYCLSRTGNPGDGERRLRACRDAAARLGALEVESLSERLLGRLLGESGRVDEALDHLEVAAGLARRAGLPEEEFICWWHAWRFADPRRRRRFSRTLRRLLREVHPGMPEARAFQETVEDGHEEDAR